MTALNINIDSDSNGDSVDKNLSLNLNENEEAYCKEPLTLKKRREQCRKKRKEKEELKKDLRTTMPQSDESMIELAKVHKNTSNDEMLESLFHELESISNDENIDDSVTKRHTLTDIFQDAFEILDSESSLTYDSATNNLETVDLTESSYYFTKDSTSISELPSPKSDSNFCNVSDVDAWISNLKNRIPLSLKKVEDLCHQVS